MFKKILVPVDGSDMGYAAAKHARILAEKFGSEITLLHVVQNYYSLPVMSMPDAATIPMSVLADLETTGRIILDKAEAIFDGFPGHVSTRLEFGSPGRILVDAAIADSFTLIVMGRRGLSGFTGLLLGSVSNHVLHYATCPTLIVKGPVQE